MLVVVKIGSSSVVDQNGNPNIQLLTGICDQIDRLRKSNHKVILVSSGAVALGMNVLKNQLDIRKDDISAKQALAAIGQFELMTAFNGVFLPHKIVTSQVLLTPNDFIHRRQYLTAKDTLETLLSMNVLPIINENDVVATDEIRFGDNDRIAALVANMTGANLLVLLTDTMGMYTADPALDENATLIKEIEDLSDQFNQMASDTSSGFGSGGMIAKIAAARIATWSGVRVIIGSASYPEILVEAVTGSLTNATVIQPKSQKLSARKLWIAFAKASHGKIKIDQGAVSAIVEMNKSLLPNGVISFEGEFFAGDAVEIISPSDSVVAKGIVKISHTELMAFIQDRIEKKNIQVSAELVHRDDLVIFSN